MEKELKDLKSTVRVHIDQKVFESPGQTTGVALYTLGSVPADLELFREVRGNEEGELVERDDETISVHQGEHFFSGKPKVYVLIVNGQKKQWPQKKISYSQVVKLAFPDLPVGPTSLFSVSFEEGPPSNPQGAMKEGDIVKVKDGMVFNVSATIQS